MIVKDKFWMWGHEVGTHDEAMYQLPGKSRMTVAEAAYYLGLRNAMMIGIRNIPAPPFDTHMIALRPMEQVVWSIMGDSTSTRIDLDEILRLSEKFPNLSGAIMDDFFHQNGGQDKVARIDVEELKVFRAKLQGSQRPLDLLATLYAHDLHLPFAPYLEQCDVTTFWTWSADKLPELEQQFRRLEELVPDGRFMLGCYLYDYGATRPMPVEMMKHQCEFGLELLKTGRVEGLIFLSNSACDHDLEAVEWTREWIQAVGGQSL